MPRNRSHETPGESIKKRATGVGACLEFRGDASSPAGGTPYRTPNQAGQGRACRPSVRPVSKTAKAGAPDSESPIPFEEALQKLESIVESMESGELTLEQLLGRFEDGARLSRACQQRLEAAEIRVQQLEKSLSGDLTVRPVESFVEDAGA